MEVSLSQYGSDVCTLRERVMEGRPAGNERGEEDENEGGEMRWREGGEEKKDGEGAQKYRGLWEKRDRQSRMVEKKQFGRRDGKSR